VIICNVILEDLPQDFVVTVCSEVMSDEWPSKNGINVQHFRDFFFLVHHSWWWERLEMPLTYLISTPFLHSWLPKI